MVCDICSKHLDTDHEAVGPRYCSSMCRQKAERLAQEVERITSSLLIPTPKHEGSQ